jgi:hypothetical protein
MNKIRKYLSIWLSMVSLAGIGVWVIGQSTGFSLDQVVSRGDKPQIGTAGNKWSETGSGIIKVVTNQGGSTLGVCPNNGLW